MSVNNRHTTAWQLALPTWVAPIVAAYQSDHPNGCADDAGRMQLALALARAAGESGDGGPFGAAVFAATDNALIAVGVNLVFASGASLAHAEMVALTLAQQTLGSHDLAAHGAYTLVTSTEPCAMCLGALPWSGIRRVVCGARSADARAIGFDEGSRPAGWVEALNARGIAVQRDILRAEAAAVLAGYDAAQRALY